MSPFVQSAQIPFMLLVIILCYSKSFYWLRLGLPFNFNAPNVLSTATLTSFRQTHYFNVQESTSAQYLSRQASSIVMCNETRNEESRDDSNTKDAGKDDDDGKHKKSSESNEGDKHKKSAEVKDDMPWEERERRGRIIQSAYYDSGWNEPKRGCGSTVTINLPLVISSFCVMVVSYVI